MTAMTVFPIPPQDDIPADPASVTAELSGELVAALDRYIATEQLSAGRPEALVAAFRDWAMAHGYLAGQEGMKPEQLNASNDG
jgi:hypothetical protein